MKRETQEIMRALENALNRDYSILLRITNKKNLVDAATSLLSYRTELEDYPENVDEGDNFWGFQPSDYEEGYVVRVKALKLLGILKDTNSIEQITQKLYDMGDKDAGGSGRVSTYYQGGFEVQSTAVETLASIGGKEALLALEKRLKVYDRPKPATLIYTEVPEHTVREAIKTVKSKL